ncbi:MAG: Na/Pi symporter [Spirochaetes bacterium]|jgi:phosphate:Na+ symporter|nr:Na/Pi symporter [Spirochaetota bacterium]
MISFADGAVIVGGAGLFLLGMNLMTEGLKSLAGDNIKTILARFTKGRFSSVALGTIVTTLVQSSHVTTIAAIGFVGAGLISFHNSLGIIFGANLGTTTIGWIVSLLGLKLKISLIALPIVAIGALCRLFSNDRVNYLGNVLAGFGLIFVGVDILQNGMVSLVEYIDLSYFSGYTIGGRLMLILVGVIMTLIMQSSGAAITMTLAALHSGGITIEQGAALVIGQNIGTTITAALAGIGGSTQAKRTAVAHVLFNLFSAGIAFAILPFFLKILKVFLEYGNIYGPTFHLSAFHTSFNILGVIIFLPIIKQFAYVVEKIIPEKPNRFTSNLDSGVSSIPSLALASVKISLQNCLLDLVVSLRTVISSNKLHNSQQTVLEVEGGLTEIRSYLGMIKTGRKSSNDLYNMHIRLLHALEHMEFIVDASLESTVMYISRNETQLVQESSELIEDLDYIINYLEKRSEIIDLNLLEESAHHINQLRYDRRHAILKKTAHGEMSPEQAFKEIESIRWLDKVSYRLWKSIYYLFGEE